MEGHPEYKEMDFPGGPEDHLPMQGFNLWSGN